MFKKVLIANRGEIAVRVLRACREMGIRSVAVYSEADRNALHVLYADEAVLIGPAPSTESYLGINRILAAAKSTGAEAIHPGYGFLAENPDLARACDKAGIVFIGPPVPAMELMGSKTASRQTLVKAGLPVVPGTDRDLDRYEEVEQVAREIGYPVMLKASAGGGGKGLRRVESPAELESAYRTARSEAQNAFGNPSIYVEKYLDHPRHVEIQVMGDQRGNLVYLGERECTLQRRHQKVLEETPSPLLDEELRCRMGEVAVRIARLSGYWNAGTVEFLVDRNRNFYFLEMNTRLQVEHPVTEMVLGIDLVREQLRIAAGEPLAWRQEEMRPRGAAMECRIYAEDPANHFFPSPGLIVKYEPPSGPGVRVDSGVYEGWRVPLEYDSLLSKLVVWGSNRSEAIARLARALDEYHILGVETTLPFFRQVVKHPDFVEGRLDTEFVDRVLAEGLLSGAELSEEGELAAALAATLESWRSRSAPDPPVSPASRWKMAGREALLNCWPERRRAPTVPRDDLRH